MLDVIFIASVITALSAWALIPTRPDHVTDTGAMVTVADLDAAHAAHMAEMRAARKVQS